MNVYVGTNSLKNAYIGEYKNWQPGANTVAYYKFENNLNDSSGNNRNLTARSGTFSYGTTSGGAYYTILNRSQWTNYIDLPFNYTAYTINIWIKGYQITSNSWGIVVEYWGGGPRIQGGAGGKTLNIQGTANPYTTTDTNWHLASYVSSNNAMTLYIDGNYYETTTASGSVSTVRFLLNNAGDTNSSTYAGYAYVSEIINENRSWTADEIAEYYDQTKGNYGL